MIEKGVRTFLHKQFDNFCHADETLGFEFWFARDLMALLGYSRWENFTQAIHRAILSCNNAGFSADDHFRGVTKMVDVGSGAKREIEDFMLTRYACYLIAQNGDPRKQEIAFAQCYFAVQTRKQELIDERIRLLERSDVRERLRESETQLSKNIYLRGVDESYFVARRVKGIRGRALVEKASCFLCSCVMAAYMYEILPDLY